MTEKQHMDKKSPGQKSKYKGLDKGAWFVLLVSSLARVICLLTIPKAEYVPNKLGELFSYGLRHHFGEFFWNFGMKPPLNTVIHGIIFKLFNDQQTQLYDVFLVFTFSLAIIGSVFLYKGLLILCRNSYLAIALAIIFSFALIPFELTWRGRHLDIPTIYLTIIFSYFWLKSLKSDKGKDVFWASLAGSFLLLQSIANTLVVPTLLLMLVVKKCIGSGNNAQKIKMTLLGLLLPLTLILGLCIKNQIVSEVFSVSTLGGMSRGNFVYLRVIRDPVQMREEIKRAGMPEWYEWCFDHAEAPLDLNGKPSIGWINFARAGGLCFKSNPHYGVGCWPNDYSALYQHWVDVGEHHLAEVVKKDWDNACERPYLFTWQSDFVGNWVSYYSKYTDKLLNSIFINHPRAYLIGMYNTHLTFMNKGPVFNRTMTARARPELPGENGSFWAVEFFVYENIVKYVYLSLPLLWLGAIVVLTLYLRSNQKRKRLEPYLDNILSACVFAMAIHILTFVFCQGASDEQERYFLQATPYLMLILSSYLGMFFDREPKA